MVPAANAAGCAAPQRREPSGRGRAAGSLIHTALPSPPAPALRRTAAAEREGRAARGGAVPPGHPQQPARRHGLRVASPARGEAAVPGAAAAPRLCRSARSSHVMTANDYHKEKMAVPRLIVKRAARALRRPDASVPPGGRSSPRPLSPV